VGSRAGLDGCGKSLHLLVFDPRTVQPDYAILANFENYTDEVNTLLEQTAVTGVAFSNHSAFEGHPPS